MAYECGLFYGAQAFGAAKQKEKQILVLDSEPYRYQKTLSDIAGKDAASHENNPFKAIEQVRCFLANKEGRKLPGASKMIDRYKQFSENLPTIAAQLQLTQKELRSLSYWKDYVIAAVEWIKENP
jgi:hypothetical protein